MPDTALPTRLAIGTPYERGYSLGVQDRESITAFLRDGTARINCHRVRPMSRPALLEVAGAFAQVISEDVPTLFAELRGMAEGAGISIAEATLLQTRRELIAWQEVPSATDCTLIAARGHPGHAIIGQTVDLDTQLRKHGRVVRFVGKDEPDVLMYTFTGLLGYLGMNSAGVAIGINMLHCRESWGLGVPPYLLVRHALRFTNVDLILAELHRIRRASSRALTICDRQRLLSVEMTPNHVSAQETELVLHTNHFLHSALLSCEAEAGARQRSSSARHRRISELVRPGCVDRDALFEAFADHDSAPDSICWHGHGEIAGMSTVAAVVMEPSGGKMTIRSGLPCVSRDQVFEIECST